MEIIPISCPHIQSLEINAVVDTLKSGNIVQGKKTKLFEKKFAHICSSKYAAAVNSGTAALHTAIYAAGIGIGDEVITTPFTFGATINSILMTGAQPTFVDIDPNTYNIDSSKIEVAITNKTKAILPVNLFGQPAEYSKLRSIAEKYKLIIIEDAAQSIGAMYKDRSSGDLGDIGCFSLYATKNIMCGEGGMITTNNKEYWKRAILFRNHGQQEGKRYEYYDIGYNYRLTDIASAIGIEQLSKLKTYTKKRQQIAKIYSAHFSKIEGIKTPQIRPDRTHVFHQYTLEITKDFKLSRDELQKYLEKKHIQTVVYYPTTLNKFKHFSKNISNLQTYPCAEYATQHVLSIPVHPLLTDKQIAYIINTISNI